ncbi:MAG: DUF1127 domain-containing protein [Rhodospirillales bacterium]|nr:DUF1127 domain-containing protein [Rhodospirillales bacterium]
MRTTGFSLPLLLREIALYLGASPWSHWRQLDDLRALDDRLLNDIGVSRADAIRGEPRQQPGNDTTMLLVASAIGRGV